jgi:hypothetical protein
MWTYGNILAIKLFACRVNFDSDPIAKVFAVLVASVLKDRKRSLAGWGR